MTNIGDDRDVFVDPVSHLPVDREHAAGKSFYRGHMYYFTSRVNKETFDDDPQLWISTPHASVTSASVLPDRDDEE